MTLFQKSVLDTALKNYDATEAKEAYREYQTCFLPKIENIKKSKEEQYQYGFLDDLFVKVLGYTLNPSPNYNIATEFKNQSNSKKADGAIMKEGEVIGVIELKSTKTKSMDSIVNQAFTYKHNHPTCRYVITSNFEKLRLYIDSSDKFIEFNLFNLNESEFIKFYYLLNKENLFANIPIKLKEQSLLQEENISNELYKKYASLRLELFENIVKNNPTIDKLTLLAKTQKLLDRMIFIFFAEDRGILPPNTIGSIIKHYKEDIEDRPLYHFYKIYFNAISNGNKKLNIPPYNGGLFAKDELLDSLIIDDEVLSNLPKELSSYDFNSEIDVNILGHIFENSLSDIEELKAKIQNKDFDFKDSKRKKDGVFYTPEYITRYIVNNTLGELCKQKKQELNLIDIEINIPKNPKKLNKKEQKIKNALEEYREFLLNLKILDPACGSGAFLNQALNFLLNEHNFIDESLKTLMGGSVLGLYDIKKDILENNLYGVDINEEAVEIAKLSLWLRTVESGRKLNNLSNKIKVGNSLIDDKEVDKKAFIWEEEFPEVFKQGGFDVIIGNPPYVNIANIVEVNQRDYFKKKFEVAKNKSDLYSFFVEKSITLLKKEKVLGFIISDSWLSTDSFSKFRKFLLLKTNILEIVKLPKSVFKDATVTPLIIFLQNSNSELHKEIKLSLYEKDKFTSMNYTLNVEEIINRHNYTISLNKNIVFRNVNTVKLKEIGKFSLGIKTSNDKKFILKEKIDEDCYLMLRGRDISRYYNKEPKEYIWYKPELMLEKKGAGVRKLEYFLREKILIQEIAKNINATFDDKKYLVNDTINILYQLDENFYFKYILVLLNSKLLNFWYENTFPSGLHVKINQLEQLEVPFISLEEQEPFTKKADFMLQLHRNLSLKKQKFINRLQSNFKLDKLSKKIENFYEYDFATLLKELKKKKVTLKLSEQDEWEEYFEDYKKEILEIQREIIKTDKDIDNMVYNLYNLTPKEINIVEGNR